jgi:hypothetical protein
VYEKRVPRRNQPRAACFRLNDNQHRDRPRRGRDAGLQPAGPAAAARPATASRGRPEHDRGHGATRNPRRGADRFCTRGRTARHRLAKRYRKSRSAGARTLGSNSCFWSGRVRRRPSDTASATFAAGPLLPRVREAVLRRNVRVEVPDVAVEGPGVVPDRCVDVHSGRAHEGPRGIRLARLVDARLRR